MTTGDPSLFELFREEVRAHAETLSRGLIETEGDADTASKIEPLMRAAHSIKGACRIVGIELGVRLAHVMEDALVAAQRRVLRLTPQDIDVLLKGTDLLAGLAELTPQTTHKWEAEHAHVVEQLEPTLAAMARGQSAVTGPAPTTAVRSSVAAPPEPVAVVNNPFANPPPTTECEIPLQPLPLAADHTVLDLLREELRANLLLLKADDPATSAEGARQIRGAARIVKCQPVEAAAAALGRYFSALAGGQTSLRNADAERWLDHAIATLAGALATDDTHFPTWLESATPALGEIAAVFDRAPDAAESPRAAPPSPPPSAPASEPPAVTPVAPAASPPGDAPTVGATPDAPAAAVVRVSAQSLTRLMGLAGESLVQARWLPSFSSALLALKKHHDALAAILDGALQLAASSETPADVSARIAEARRQAGVCLANLADKSYSFEDHAARAEDLNARLYREVIVSRMRPFGDGIRGLPRLVRDMARTLGKSATLLILGEQTEVDRDILEKLESPLSHLVRNAIDHGVESPDERAAAGKPAAATVRLEARHRAGMLLVTIADDGRGVDLDRLRRKIVERGLNSAEMVGRMTDSELLEFLFLPGFTTTSAVTEFSGRGVGLDVVQDTVRKAGGSVRITTQAGRGTTFHLQLPLTLSVIRAVVVDVAGEPYAFPHTRIDRLIRVPRTEVRSLEHRQFVTVDGQHVGLVIAAQLLDLPVPVPKVEDLSVVLLSDTSGTYGLVVDAVRGEQDLVVRPLDPRLGKVPNLSAAAILDDGSPVLIVDAEDLIRAMDHYIQSGALSRCDTRPADRARKKRILVVDDSITVREVERQLLLHKGYEVEVAVDGVDGWNKVRGSRFDLLVSDVDMPRMTGLQLVSAVRGDEKLRALPVVIVSYKEREEDRLKGLDAGANAYLTKSSFHDNSFLQAVEDLIGAA